MSKFEDVNSISNSFEASNSAQLHSNLLDDAMRTYSAHSLKSIGAQVGAPVDNEIANAYRHEGSHGLHRMSIEDPSRPDVSRLDPGIHHLNTDVIAKTLGGYLDNKWEDVKEFGSVEAAAELQKFADSASRNRGGQSGEILSKIYDEINPEAAAKLQQAISKNQVIDFT